MTRKMLEKQHHTVSTLKDDRHTRLLSYINEIPKKWSANCFISSTDFASQNFNFACTLITLHWFVSLLGSNKWWL